MQIVGQGLKVVLQRLLKIKKLSRSNGRFELVGSAACYLICFCLLIVLLYQVNQFTVTVYQYIIQGNNLEFNLFIQAFNIAYKIMDSAIN